MTAAASTPKNVSAVALRAMKNPGFQRHAKAAVWTLRDRCFFVNKNARGDIINRGSASSSEWVR